MVGWPNYISAAAAAMKKKKNQKQNEKINSVREIVMRKCLREEYSSVFVDSVFLFYF